MDGTLEVSSDTGLLVIVFDYGSDASRCRLGRKRVYTVPCMLTFGLVDRLPMRAGSLLLTEMESAGLQSLAFFSCVGLSSLNLSTIVPF